MTTALDREEITRQLVTPDYGGKAHKAALLARVFAALDEADARIVASAVERDEDLTRWSATARCAREATERAERGADAVMQASRHMVALLGAIDRGEGRVALHQHALAVDRYISDAGSALESPTSAPLPAPETGEGGR